MNEIVVQMLKEVEKGVGSVHYEIDMDAAEKEVDDEERLVQDRCWQEELRVAQALLRYAIQFLEKGGE